MTDRSSITNDAKSNQQFAAQVAHIQSQLDESQRSRLGKVLRSLLTDRTLGEARLNISGKTVRQLPDMYGHNAVGRVEKRRNVLADVCNQFPRGTLHDVQWISCPLCTGALHGEFELNSPQPDGSMAGYMRITRSTL